MAAQTNVGVLKEVALGVADGWRICLQWCVYIYPDEDAQHGYRFIWRRPESGALQAARGQARLPSLAIAEKLIALARAEGWANNAATDAEDYL
ncbi:MAG: hypothetical protein M3R64_08490 [Pseudomonadota bacterium]|nr:hypothetical protein [Pseudomonadota bacterium]